MKETIQRSHRSMIISKILPSSINFPSTSQIKKKFQDVCLYSEAFTFATKALPTHSPSSLMKMLPLWRSICKPGIAIPTDYSAKRFSMCYTLRICLNRQTSKIEYYARNQKHLFQGQEPWHSFSNSTLDLSMLQTAIEYKPIGKFNVSFIKIQFTRK